MARANGRLGKSRRRRRMLEVLRAAVTGVILSGALVIGRNALESGGLVLLGALARALYRRLKPSPMGFMLVMGGVCGVLRWALAG